MEREKPPLDKLYGALADTILVCQLTNVLPVGDVLTETSVGSDLLPFPSPYTATLLLRYRKPATTWTVFYCKDQKFQLTSRMWLSDREVICILASKVRILFEGLSLHQTLS